jgi:hypothetical protein
MVKLQYFSYEVFHIGENYLEASERCAEGHPQRGSFAVNALLWPSEHCAIIACELFLKSLIAQSEKAETGEGYTPTYDVKVPRLNKQKEELFRPHIGEDLIDYVKSTKVGQLVWETLDRQEQNFLLENADRFAGTRYPFEREDIKPNSRYLKIARKLREIIREIFKPDDAGNITLELKISDSRGKFTQDT